MTFKSSHSIYLCIKDSAFVKKLSLLLQEVGYHVEGFSDLDEFQKFVFDKDTTVPDAIVMNLTFPQGDNAGVETLSRLRQQFKTLPLVICCKKDALQDRLNALRAGATRYFAAPVDCDHLIDTLGDLTGMQPVKPYRVLIVDDDTISLDIYSDILRHAGVNAFTLSDPMDALKVADRVTPEVIVLDVKMPNVSGFELAAIIRERENCRDVPILFLTADAEISTELDALRLGGDAYYVKPVEGHRFKDAVVSRAKRYRERIQSRERLNKLLYEREREHWAIDHHAQVSVTDKLGDIISVNDMFCRINGYSRAELLGQNHRILKSGKHDDEYYRGLWRTILKGETWYGEKCNKRKDGSFYWIEATITAFLDSSGKPYQYVSISTDITERKENELILMEAKKQAEEANQAKSEFLANMSHELRTPLNAIVGFSQLLDIAPDLQPEYQQDAAEIHKAGKHLLGLINDILELSKIESGHVAISIEEVNLKSVVSECVSMVTQLALDRGLTFSCDDFDGSINVLGDRTKIRQVLLNLLSNAIKYNVDAGDVRIIIQQEANNFIKISVKDSGIGISEEEIRDLFKPFSRLDARLSDIEGTGIGLTITKEMIERMNGEVGVDSEKGVGSEFWFTLPWVLPKQSVDCETSEIEVPHEIELKNEKHIKIVCVDDNETNLDILNQLLSREECYEVHCVLNSLNAISKMLEVLPDVVLLDVHMPNLDGYEVLELIQAESRLSDCKVVALTAAALEQDREKGLKAGFYKYLTKPLDYNVLKQTLVECVNKS